MHVVCDLDYHQEPLVDSIQPLNLAYWICEKNGDFVDSRCEDTRAISLLVLRCFGRKVLQ